MILRHEYEIQQQQNVKILKISQPHQPLTRHVKIYEKIIVEEKIFFKGVVRTTPTWQKRFKIKLLVY